MSRRHRAEKRPVFPDPKFKDTIVSKFMSCLMFDGKRSVAERIVYDALDKLAQKTKVSHVEAFDQAINNVKPMMEVKSRRVGGSTYQVPVEVNTKRKQSLAMRWILEAADKRNEKTMKSKLAAELLDAYSNKGSAVKKREDVHKMAESNRAFAHYRW